MYEKVIIVSDLLFSFTFTMSTAKYSDLINRDFGALTTTDQFSKQPHGSKGGMTTKILCHCLCGKSAWIVPSALNQGRRTSCGCGYIRDAFLSELGKQNLTHGYRTKKQVNPDAYLYKLWAGIKQRCFNSNQDDFKYYGGRGISMQENWINDFSQFESDVLEIIGHRPDTKHSLDRIDNDGSYTKHNIRWATRSVQNENRRPVKWSENRRAKLSASKSKVEKEV